MKMTLWFSNLLFWSAQVVVLVTAAGLLSRLFQIRQPRALLNYWRGLLLICFVLPLLQPWHRLPSSADVLVVPVVSDVAFSPSPTPAATTWHFPSMEVIAQLIGITIVGGIALRFAILALGLWRLRRFRQASSPILSADSAAILDQMRAHVGASAEFRLSASVDSPVTFGLARPVILLPEQFLTTDARFQSAIACHELLHVRRRDWAHHLAEEIVRAVFWFHPAIAWLISRVRLAREQMVDLEVVRLTNARKAYLEALLEFTAGRTRIAAIPAPPFLAERQLVERITLMLKEVRMSRTRLIVSLTASSLCIGLAAIFAIWSFPLKAAARPAKTVTFGVAQENSSGAAPVLQKIQVKHYDFGKGGLSDAVVNEEEARLNQLSGRLRPEASYEQTKADEMKKALQEFWNERGITVEVQSALKPSARSSPYAVLEFDVYRQAVLPGRLGGGVNGGVNAGVTGGVANGVSRGVAGGVSGIGAGAGVIDGVPGGVSGGVNDGVNGGVSGERRTQASSDMPNVDYSTIWIDTVKRGPMVRQVRGLGKLVRPEGSTNLVAQVTLPTVMTADVKPGENAAIATRKGPLANGHVSSISPSTSGDTRTVDIALGTAPEGASAGLEVDGTIDIEKIDGVLQVGRPVHGAQNTGIPLFKIVNNSAEAVRIYVKLGRASVNTVEVLAGLKEGDRVILSDMSQFENADRIHLTDEKHVLKH
jgi:beta-lactamase regulating signal transducer with metallopeptidase domain